MAESKIVMRDSDEAASLQKVEGWVSRKGRFFGWDERTARYDGATHQVCETEGCGEVIPIQGRTICEECRLAKRNAKYHAMDVVEWDEKTPIVLYDDDRYFFSPDDLETYCDNQGVNVCDLQLVLCEPQYGRELDPDEFLIGELPEDNTDPLTQKVYDAALEFNESVREMGPLSWCQGDVAVRVGNQESGLRRRRERMAT